MRIRLVASSPRRLVASRLAQRLVGVLRLICAVETTDRGANADVLPQEAARLVNQLRQRPYEVLAVDVGADALGIGVLDADDLALGKMELRVVTEHQQAGVCGVCPSRWRGGARS